MKLGVSLLPWMLVSAPLSVDAAENDLRGLRGPASLHHHAYVPRGLRNASSSAAARRRWLAGRNKDLAGRNKNNGGKDLDGRFKDAAKAYLQRQGFQGVKKATGVPLGRESKVVAVHTQQEAHGIPVRNSDALLIVDAETGDVVKSVTQSNGRIHGIQGAIESKAKKFNSAKDMSLEETIGTYVAEDEGFTCEEVLIEEEGQWEGWTECGDYYGRLSYYIPRDVKPEEDPVIHLAWEVHHPETSNEALHGFYDARTGEALEVEDWVKGHIDADSVHLHDDMRRRLEGETYQALPLGLDDAEAGASSFTTVSALDADWHQVGSTTYPYTRGNNVCTYTDSGSLNPGNCDAAAVANYEDEDSPGSKTYSVNYNPLEQPTTPDNLRTAIVNLFVWNNLIHDFLYGYGFDEPSGNFQQTNGGLGGNGNDPVRAEAQDGSGTNNANMMTPGDGGIPRMQMFRTTYTTPNRDTSLDNVIIAHEYGHGLSNRLTGGPAASGCLGNSEQAGEGWSDLLGMFMTHTPSDTRTTQRGTGEWSFNRPGGIRNDPYTTDMNVNGWTYADRSGAGLSVPHGVGFLWATIYWEVYWNLIDLVGFDEDLTASGTGGNNIAIQLYIDGMKLQPCSPNYVDARDAILLADEQNYGGQFKCEIWAGFAKRGLGAGITTANQSGESYVVDPICLDGPSVYCSPSSHTALFGSAGIHTSECTVQANGLYTGTVDLSCPDVSGITCTINGGTSVTLGAGASDTRFVTYNYPSTLAIGQYSLTLTGEDSVDSSKYGSSDVILNVAPSTYRSVPACLDVGSECSSGISHDGKGTHEDNQPNTIDGCADGTAGGYHSDESNDKLEIKTTSGNPFAAGETVEVNATVWAWSTGTSDRADLYYTRDATVTPVVWEPISVNIMPDGGGARIITAQYIVPEGGASLHAVRANFRYGGSVKTCSTGSYDDTDDLVFAVGAASPVTSSPVTPSPVTSSPVSSSPVTSSPVTPSPVTSSPVTSSPVTASPVTASPIDPPTTGSPTLMTTTLSPVSPNTPTVDISLETNPSCSSTGGAGGIWFDVVAKNDLTVTSLAFETTYLGGHQVRVYTKAGTHVGQEQNATAWTLLADPDVPFTVRRPNGAWPPISTHLPESLFSQPIAANDRRAFYIHITTSYLTYGQNFDGNNAVGALQVEDDNIQQFVGSTECGGGEFGCKNTIKMFNGFIHYTTGVAPTSPPTTAAPTPQPTNAPTSSPVTPNPTSPPTPAPTNEPTNEPTPSPVTPNPTSPPTSAPTNEPTNEPTNDPTGVPTSSPVTPNPTSPPTSAPTNEPTNEPTNDPTGVPTSSPTVSPTVSSAPTEFEPEIVEVLSPSPGPASIAKALYFNVQGGDVWTKITDLQITSYGANHLQVYAKKGEATPYEATPCEWQLIAETAPGWSAGYWDRLYPEWDFFVPFVMPANETVAIYVVNMGTSYGILSKSCSACTNAAKYSPWISTDSSSPAGAVSLSHGSLGYMNEPFHPYPSYYRGYGIWGGVKLETMQPGSTGAPTMAPTNMVTPGSLDSIFPGPALNALHVNGYQFDVDNNLEDDVVVTNFEVAFEASGTYRLEVWSREGSHQGSAGGCDNWNNWCNAWTLLGSSDVTYSGSGLASSAAVIGIIKANSTASFALISGDGKLVAHDGSLSAPALNNDIETSPSTLITDYYAGNVQTLYGITTPTTVFYGSINYEIAHSLCAVQSMAPWVNTEGLIEDVGKEELLEIITNPNKDDGSTEKQ